MPFRARAAAADSPKYEIGFARSVADCIIFMDNGEIVEQGAPKEFFNNPKSERTKLFLPQILHH
jgi:ABC-type polar amino acid transport system ATPase subunit